MKAYKVWDITDDDKGEWIIFAETANEARQKGMLTDLDADRYLDVYAKREPDFDGMQNKPEYIIALKQWREGWSFNDIDEPDPDKDTDEDFLRWYKNRRRF